MIGKISSFVIGLIVGMALSDYLLAQGRKPVFKPRRKPEQPAVTQPEQPPSEALESNV
jgi:hypothetical protein